MSINIIVGEGQCPYGDLNDDFECPEECFGLDEADDELEDDVSEVFDELESCKGDVSNLRLGRCGESAAAKYLVFNGYQILERNWRCRYGEADIIALDEDGTVCFIEVKTRRGVDRGFPEEAITPAKQHRYERIALSFMMNFDWDDCTRIRFDAIGLCVKSDSSSAVIRHHKGCFNGLF